MANIYEELLKAPGETGTAKKIPQIAEQSVGITAPDSFQYGNQDAYRQLLDSVMKQQEFRYDPETDPAFSAYRKSYLREGDRASANALAKASATSGGQPSSYAVTAAQQANNYYAGKLADIIPAMEENAYSRYLDQFSQKLKQLGALEDDRAFDYQKYLDQLEGQVQAQQMAQNVNQQKYENALALYQLLGYATPEVAEILGISAGVSGSEVGGNGNGVTGDGIIDDGVIDDGVSDITNETGVDANGTEWVNVGGQVMDWSMLAQMIASGKVREIVDPSTGKRTYQYVGNGNNSGNSGNRGTSSASAPSLNLAAVNKPLRGSAI